MARDHDMPILVFNMNKPGALRRVIMGEEEGTLIRAKKLFNDQEGHLT